MEILARHLGLVGASTVKTPGDKNDIDKTSRYRDVDGESEGLDEETANYVDELFLKKKHGMSQGRSPSSPMRNSRVGPTRSRTVTRLSIVGFRPVARVTGVLNSAQGAGWRAQMGYGGRASLVPSGCPSARSASSLTR